MNVRHSHATIVSAILLVLGCSTAIAAPPAKTMTVDCASGQTIADALNKGNTDQPLLVIVRGSCSESVRIDRSDITLRGDAGVGGSITGPDPSIDTVTVVANRVSIEDLGITGGRNGITGLGAAGLAVRNTTIQSTGRNGVSYADGSSGTVEGCTIQSNARDGVSVEKASAVIINSTISSNSRAGVLIGTGGSARIGVDNRNRGVPRGAADATGNLISDNGGTGVNIITGGAAIVGMNQITGNGTDPNSTAGRFGININQATADIPGGNTISGNVGSGINLRIGSANLGNPSFGFSTLNTISENGSATSPGGISAFLGSALVIRDATISNNNGAGVLLNLRSTAQLNSSTISDNRAIAGGICPGGNTCGDGIRLSLGSGLLSSFPPPPALATPSTISGNDGAGIKCNDQESSAAIALGSLVTTQTNDCSFF